MIKKEPFYYREVKLTYEEVLAYHRMMEVAIVGEKFDVPKLLPVIKKMYDRFGKQTTRNFNKICKQHSINGKELINGHHGKV